ncbi:MAG: hypothetical protein V4864_07675 [Pseudomonadota bacterium]
MSVPKSPADVLVLPRDKRDFILAALGEASSALSQTHGLRATTHILLQGGVQLTGDNSFRIDHRDPMLLVNLIRRMLSADEPPLQDS